MRTAYDDILADGLKRRHPVQQIIGALLKAEIADKTARSIKYRPEVEVYFGHFLSHRVRAPLVQPVGNQRTAEIVRTEEKGSDINLAVHLLNDGWLDPPARRSVPSRSTAPARTAPSRPTTR